MRLPLCLPHFVASLPSVDRFQDLNEQFSRVCFAFSSPSLTTGQSPPWKCGGAGGDQETEPRPLGRSGGCGECRAILAEAWGLAVSRVSFRTDGGAVLVPQGDTSPGKKVLL